MIFADPTETASNSKIHNAGGHIIECVGFENLTGADLLISPLTKPYLTNANNSLGIAILQKHLEAGAILIQRKSGQDIINFIKDHDNILLKMRKWTERPWLLTIGNYSCDNDNKLLINNQRAGGSDGWSYWSYWGALHAWQMRGGFIDNITRDTQLLDWEQHILRIIEQHGKDVLVSPKKPSQNIIAAIDEDDPNSKIRANCINALTTIDGVSLGKATAITDYCGDLKNALLFLSDPTNIKLKKNDESYPKGIGSGIFANAAKWLNLESGGVDKEQWCEILRLVTHYPFHKKLTDQELDLPY